MNVVQFLSVRQGESADCPYYEVQIGGYPVTMIVDTGGTDTVVSGSDRRGYRPRTAAESRPQRARHTCCRAKDSSG